MKLHIHGGIVNHIILKSIKKLFIYLNNYLILYIMNITEENLDFYIYDAM